MFSVSYMLVQVVMLNARRETLSDPLMGSSHVEVHLVLANQPIQVPVAEQDLLWLFQLLQDQVRLTWDRRLAKPCPQCGAAFVVQKVSRAGVRLRCLALGCGWTAEPDAPAAPDAKALS